MENEKLRHVVFAIICAICLVMILNQPPPKKDPHVKEISKKNDPIKSDKTTPTNNDKENTDPEEVKKTPIEKESVEIKNYSIADTPALEPKEITIDTKEFKFIFSNQGGTLINLKLHHYKTTFEKDSPDYQLIHRKKAKWKKMLSVQGFDGLFNDAEFKLSLKKKEETSILSMNCVRKGIEVVKTIEINSEGFDFQFEIKVINHRKNEITNDLRFVGVVDMEFDLKDHNSIMSDQIATLINDNGDYISAGDMSWFGTYGARESIHDLALTPFIMGPYRKTKEGKRDGAKVVWGALKNRYFAIIFKPSKDNWTVNSYIANLTKEENSEKKKNKDIVPILEWQALSSKLSPGQSFEETFKVYAGPTKNGIINDKKYEKDHFEDVIDYGFLFPRFLKYFDSLLNFIIKIVGENQYWLGIILLTLMVRMAMFPITRKSSMSQAKLQKVTPKLKEIREKFKGDNRKIQEETMKLYKTEGVNPFSSCLPMFLQMPIFLGLYWTFMLTFEVRFKSFLWIDDLAVADRLFHHGLNLFIVGAYFNLLPLLYAVINYFHMSSMPAPQDPMQAQQQKIMRYIFPVMMLMFFYQMPSALVLYFIISGTWSIVEQKLIKAKIKKLEVVKS